MPIVLLVDDDPEVLAVVRMTLEVEGHAVVSAPSRAAAHKAMAKGGIDIVVTDSMLRGGNGDDVAKAAQRAGLPVIIVSGEPERVKRHEIGRIPFLAKPFHPSELAALITQLLHSGN